MAATMYNFFKKHIYSSKTQIKILILAASFIYLKTVGKIKQQTIAQKINNKTSLDEKSFTELIYFTITSLVYICSSPCLDVLASSFKDTILNEVVVSSYSYFTKYKYNDHGENIAGDLYSVIIRRAIAVSEFFKIGAFDAFDSGLYIIAGICTLLYRNKLELHFCFGIIFLILAPVFLNSLSLIRNKVQNISNSKYDIGECALKDILLNYEMIHTYNTFDEEMLKYREAMKSAKVWFIIYWLCNDVLSAIYLITKYLLIFVVLGTIDPAKTTPEDLFLQMTFFQSVSKRMYAFSGHIKNMTEATENALHCKLDLLNIDTPTGHIRKIYFDNYLEVKNFTKFYNETQVLKNVNIQIAKGEKVAITGLNGTGKSSFVKSLVEIEKYGGEILIDGVNTNKIFEPDFRKLISYVPQDAAIFDATVYENITGFNEKISAEDVYRSVKDYGMQDDFNEIGYNTVLLDNGNNISAAQRQKICIMRAILRDSQIYVFDEVTSDMDKHCEEALIDFIANKMKNKTVIAIVHNVDLLCRFDKIIYFENKTTSGSTTFDNLMLSETGFKTLLKR